MNSPPAGGSPTNSEDIGTLEKGSERGGEGQRAVEIRSRYNTFHKTKEKTSNKSREESNETEAAKSSIS